jgi:hypothetical protein
LVEADKFTVKLTHTRVRIASETAELGVYLGDCGYATNRALATTGLLLGQPAQDGDVGRPMWVLYESNSVVLRRSTRPIDTFAAADYHLRSLEHASVAEHRLPMLARILVMPSGAVWLLDPFANSTLPGMDRALARRGITVLPTTVASIDVERGTVVLPQDDSKELPDGELSIERLMYRDIPPMEIDGEAHLRFARSVVRTASTELRRTIEQIGRLVDSKKPRPELMSIAQLENEVDRLRTCP